MLFEYGQIKKETVSKVDLPTPHNNEVMTPLLDKERKKLVHTYIPGIYID
jgi:hypothetical protein